MCFNILVAIGLAVVVSTSGGKTRTPGNNASPPKTARVIEANNTWTLCFTPDSKYLATVSDKLKPAKSLVRIWNVPAGKQVDVFSIPERCSTMKYSPDGQLAAVVGIKRIVGKRFGFVYFYKTSSWKKIKEIFVPDWPAPIAYSPDGKFFAIGLGRADNFNGTAVFDAGSFQKRFVVRSTKRTGRSGLLVFSPDSKYLVAGSTSGPDRTAGGYLTAWEIPSGKERVTKKITVLDADSGFAAVSDLCFLSDSRHIAASYARRFVSVLDIEKRAIRTDLSKLRSSGCIAAFPKGNIFATHIAGGVRLNDLKLNQVRAVLPGPSLIKKMQVSPDGKWLGTCDMRGIIRVWRVDQLLKWMSDGRYTVLPRDPKKLRELYLKHLNRNNEPYLLPIPRNQKRKATPRFAPDSLKRNGIG